MLDLRLNLQAALNLTPVFSNNILNCCTFFLHAQKKVKLSLSFKAVSFLLEEGITML